MKMLAFMLLILISFNLTAETRIAILDFDLKDLTLKPYIPAEIKRTASIKPLLEKELKSAQYRIVEIPLTAQKAADAGEGYLFDHPEAAAQLGKNYGADYVLVGKLHKPSYLFVYLLGNLVNTDTGQLLGKLITESKGSELKLTVKAVESMAAKIDELLDHRYSPPPPNPAKANSN